ncbi:MAG TPA: radical SAM protein [Thermodesulfobacteriota bacterium]|nr:radical SAM protein [Deltaproteobacteria bacterium]HNU71498.1 radical SAM protein [Thermodesulfobacteriota bacterium]HQO77354.1 radical SAM protein [Thermodesulfobacteriota bacterium]
MSFIPSYIILQQSGELADRIDRLNAMLASCSLCPRTCKVNRLEGTRGVCGAGRSLVVASAFPHFGEEPPLVGRHGSGTIFLSHCNLRCVFCQNHDISHHEEGSTITSEDLGRLMIGLQERGCHNINFVTPTQYAPQIVAALPDAISRGLRIPLVYNCGGYESLETIRLLDRIVDIYMPDMKFSSSAPAHTYCTAPDYPEVVKAVLREMHRQVGVLSVDSYGIAERGLLIRHLVMPEGLAGTEETMRFVAEELSPDSYVNIMDQYYPHYHAHQYPEINRCITAEEYRSALACARRYGLHRGLSS